MAWGPILYLRGILGDDTTLGPLLGAFSCGFSVLIEKKNRRRQLAMYALPRAMESWWIKLTRSGLIRGDFTNGEVWLFSVAAAVVMQSFYYDPESVDPSVYRLLK
jgi:hypothetical protein